MSSMTTNSSVKTIYTVQAKYLSELKLKQIMITPQECISVARYILIDFESVIYADFKYVTSISASALLRYKPSGFFNKNTAFLSLFNHSNSISHNFLL